MLASRWNVISWKIAARYVNCLISFETSRAILSALERYCYLLFLSSFFFFFFSRDERIDERISVIILLDRRNLIACIWTIPNNSFFPESNNKINGRKGGERQKSSEIGGGSGNVEAECKVSTYLLLCMNCVAHFFNKFLLILLHHFFVNCFIPCSFSFPFFFTHIAPYNHKNRIHELIL